MNESKASCLISVVIPVYKSTKSLEIITEEIRLLFSKLELSYELIFVNDSPSYFSTNKTLNSLKNKDENVKVYTLRKNQGQHIAVLAGMKMSSGNYIITLDDDLQHPIKEIPKLLDEISNNAKIDAIFAIPEFRKAKHNFFRRIGSSLINSLTYTYLKKPKNLKGSSFRIVRRELVNFIVNNYNALPSISSLLINSSENIINITVEHNQRAFGKSNYSLSKLLTLTLNNILHYSSLPLKYLGIIGFLVFLLSFIFAAYVIIKKIFWGIDYPGYASTITLISFFGGLNLLGLGIVGEYLIRILKEQQKVELTDLIKDNNN